MKKLFQFLARLVGISLLFIPFLSGLHYAYRFVLALITTAQWPNQEVIGILPYDGSNNLYTFLVLILATLGLKVKRRVIGIIVGIAMFLLTDAFMIAVWIPYLKTPRPSLANMAVSYGWLVVAHYLMPFLLWLLFAFTKIDELFRGAIAGSDYRVR